MPDHHSRLFFFFFPSTPSSRIAETSHASPLVFTHPNTPIRTIRRHKRRQDYAHWHGDPAFQQQDHSNDTGPHIFRALQKKT